MSNNKLEYQNRKERNSTFEVLRIIAMFMVLALHVNFYANGSPKIDDVLASPVASVSRVFFQALAIGAVNTFILISGWFGIRSTTKGLCKFLFQCAFFIVLLGIIGYLSGREYDTLSVLFSVVLFTNAWFVVSYIGLYIVSPILNAYIEKVSEKDLLKLLIVFYLFQTYFGWIGFDTQDFSKGFSMMSFIGLYLLGRYLRLYGDKYYKYGVYLWLGGVLLCFGFRFMLSIWDVQLLRERAMVYTNPMIILSAVGLIMMFATFKPFENRVVNFIAASSFTVYLIHMCNGWTEKLYVSIARNIYAEYSGVSFLIVIMLFMIGVFALAVVLDQLRKFTWKYVEQWAFGQK